LPSDQWRTKASPSRKPKDAIHHSDEGSQYTSWAFGLRCRAAGIRPSTATAGDALDDAMCESFFATLECELIDRHRSATKAEAQIAAFGFVEGFSNPSRRRSSIGHLPPNEFEAAHQPDHAQTDTPKPQNLSAKPRQLQAQTFRIRRAPQNIMQSAPGGRGSAPSGRVGT
jgi:putative transposase